ncbi:MAG TPA: lipoate--protein ligase family protein [Thermofilaceae archaeon]|nr:lipoate--protein ligase family protein [Thermofilaceae archaeon]
MARLVVGEALKKARKGLIRVRLIVDEESRVIKDVRLTGDFFMYPEDALWSLESSLRGVPLDLNIVSRIVREQLKSVVLVGSTTQDFLEAIAEAERRIEGGRRE